MSAELISEIHRRGYISPVALRSALYRAGVDGATLKKHPVWAPRPDINACGFDQECIEGFLIQYMV